MNQAKKTRNFTNEAIDGIRIKDVVDLLFHNKQNSWEHKMNSKQFNAIVADFQSATDKNNNYLKMHSLLIQEQDEVYVHHFRKVAEPSDVRSISKTILTLAFGRVMALVDAGKYPAINEDSKIYPIIKEIIHLENTDNLEKLKQVKIKHLLTHSIGYEEVLLMRGDIVDIDPFELLDYVINYPIVHQPGEYYLYSNAGFYLLSVVLEEFLKEDLTNFLKRELFIPLGIEQFRWDKYGKYLAGATRLFLLPEDLVKFGELFLNHGKVNGERLITEDWLDKMLTLYVYTKDLDVPKRTFRRYGYGYGTWLAEDSFYFAHGTDGQRLIILPEKDTILLTLAEQPDTEPIDELLNEIIEKPE